MCGEANKPKKIIQTGFTLLPHWPLMRSANTNTETFCGGSKGCRLLGEEAIVCSTVSFAFNQPFKQCISGDKIGFV